LAFTGSASERFALAGLLVLLGGCFFYMAARVDRLVTQLQSESDQRS